MAVKRIRQVPEAKCRTLCRECGYEVEYTLNDVQKYEGRDISGGPDGREWIECPCGHEITLRRW